jgi:hypothetical protein
MGTLKDYAKTYVAKKTKNVADLPEVAASIEIYHDGTGTDQNGEEFTYSYLEINGEEYRVPGSVIGQLKDLLEANANLTRFKVKKTGEGLKTRYTVIPLQ